jgi:undecaprenyl diphosphate synthase
MVHIAIIMDGNGRWAKQRGLSRIEGHQAGLHTFQTVALHAAQKGIAFLTVYAFSIQNWSRPSTEVKGLFTLANECFSRMETFQKADIRVRIQGVLDLYPRAVQKTIQEAVQKTANNKGMVLTIALSYGGREEIVETANQLCQSGSTTPVTLASFESAINPDGIPPPDLIVRTSGEFRVSNFLLWQSAYAEYYITETLWPDFTPAHFDEALQSLASRSRRFGNVENAMSFSIPTEDTIDSLVRTLWKLAETCMDPESQTEFRKYKDNQVLRKKYGEYWKMALWEPHSPTNSCVPSNLWERLEPFYRGTGSELYAREWSKWLSFVSWLQTSHSIPLSRMQSDSPLDLFRLLKPWISEDAEELLKEHLIELPHELRNVFVRALGSCDLADPCLVAQSLFYVLYPFLHSFVGSKTIGWLSVMLACIVGTCEDARRHTALLELAIQDLKPYTTGILAKLKTGLVYLFLFRNGPISQTQLLRYLYAILE